MAEALSTRKPGRSVFFKEPNGSKPRTRDGASQSRIDSTAVGAAAEAPLRLLLDALNEVIKGNFSVRLAEDQDGLLRELAQAFNEVIRLNETLANEIVRVSKIISEEGKLTERTALAGATGMWANKVVSINTLIDSLAQQTTEVGRVITAVAQGDLSKKMMLEIQGRPVQGEFLRIGTIVNTMVDQMGSFASEVTRVAKEVGTEGKLGWSSTR